MAFKKIQKNIRQGRVGQWLRVNYRFALRKVRRFFAGDIRQAASSRFARHLYLALGGMVISILCLVGAQLTTLHLEHREEMIIAKLTYGADYDTNIPYFRTLHAIGSSNHLCVTVKTAARDNISDRGVALEDGGVNLKISFRDGSTRELPLLKKYRHDSFTAGKETDFIVTLPFGYTPFDIATCALTVTAGADGSYDDWSCEHAEVSMLLSGKRTLIAADAWNEPTRFGSGTNMLRSAELKDHREGNKTYHQMGLLFERLLDLSQRGLTDFTDATLKQNTLSSLALSNATALYMDVETVSAERNSNILTTLGDGNRLSADDDLNYNGLLWVDVTFNAELPEGGYTKRYALDTPGKDDFEMSSASTFRMDMPEGMCIFDIAEVALSTADKSDGWAPRFVRLYLTLDFEQELEIARMTDRSLEQQYDTPIFYQGYLDTPIRFDLSAHNSIPAAEYAAISETYGIELSEAGYKMYFEDQSFYSRQIHFYSHMLGLI